MIDKIRFVKALKYLNAIYPTFKLNTDDDMIISAWYGLLNHIDDDKFKEVIEYYCKTQDYPPQSPRSILKVYEEVMKTVKGVMSADEAWELVRSTLRVKSIQSYQTLSGKYHNDFYEALSDHNIIKACKEIDSKLRDLNSDNSSYASHEFKLIYNRHVENESKKDVLKIGNDDKLKLGE